jgi:hypothetical protein
VQKSRLELEPSYPSWRIVGASYSCDVSFAQSNVVVPVRQIWTSTVNMICTVIVTSSARVWACRTHEYPPQMILLVSRILRSALNAVTALTGLEGEVKTKPGRMSSSEIPRRRIRMLSPQNAASSSSLSSV